MHCGDLTSTQVAGWACALLPIPLLLAFPPPGPHFRSEELIEAVLLPAFTVRHGRPLYERKPPSHRELVKKSPGIISPTRQAFPLSLRMLSKAQHRKHSGGHCHRAALSQRSDQAQRPGRPLGGGEAGLHSQRFVAPTPFHAGLSPNS